MAEVEAAAAATAMSLAAAKADSPAEGIAGTQTLQRWSLLPPEAAVTLVAVPIHTDIPSRRYNPYHVRIIGREVDDGGERRTEELMEGVPGNSQYDFGGWEDEDLPEELSPRKESVAGPNGDDRGNQELGQTQADVERAFFSLKGVTFVNVHGETSFQPLEEWRQEKERFDTLRRLTFVRR